jgi:predicted nucleic acid-binding protein
VKVISGRTSFAHCSATSR